MIETSGSPTNIHSKAIVADVIFNTVNTSVIHWRQTHGCLLFQMAAALSINPTVIDTKPKMTSKLIPPTHYIHTSTTVDHNRHR